MCAVQLAEAHEVIELARRGGEALRVVMAARVLADRVRDRDRAARSFQPLAVGRGRYVGDFGPSRSFTDAKISPSGATPRGL